MPERTHTTFHTLREKLDSVVADGPAEFTVVGRPRRGVFRVAVDAGDGVTVTVVDHAEQTD